MSKERSSTSSRLSGRIRGARNATAEADRHVDPEDPLPAEPLGQDPAEQDARGAAGPRDRAPDAERLVALGTLVPVRGDDRQGGRRDDRRAEALEGAGDDQEDVRGRQAAGQRGEREEHEAADEHPPAPEQVGEPSAEQQEAAEEEGVGVDDPGEVVLAELEVAADRREGDVDDRGVDDDQELGHREQDEGDRLLAGGLERGHAGPLTWGEGERPFRLRSARYGAMVPFVNTASRPGHR